MLIETRLNRDPHCRRTQLENGTVVLTYDGYIGTWETVEMACTGANLLSANIGIMIIAMLLTFGGMYMAVSNGRRR